MAAGGGIHQNVFETQIFAEFFKEHIPYCFCNFGHVRMRYDNAVIGHIISYFVYFIHYFFDSGFASAGFIAGSHLPVAPHIYNGAYAYKISHKRGEVRNSAASAELRKVLNKKVNGEFVNFRFGPF